MKVYQGAKNKIVGRGQKSIQEFEVEGKSGGRADFEHRQKDRELQSTYVLGNSQPLDGKETIIGVTK